MKNAKLSCWEKSQSRELTPRALSRRFTALNKKNPTSQAGFYVEPPREELDALMFLAEPKAASEAKAMECVGGVLAFQIEACGGGGSCWA